jgi:hypothetical protein
VAGGWGCYAWAAVNSQGLVVLGLKQIVGARTVTNLVVGRPNGGRPVLLNDGYAVLFLRNFDGIAEVEPAATTDQGTFQVVWLGDGCLLATMPRYGEDVVAFGPAESQVLLTAGVKLQAVINEVGPSTASRIVTFLDPWTLEKTQLRLRSDALGSTITANPKQAPLTLRVNLDTPCSHQLVTAYRAIAQHAAQMVGNGGP